MHVQLYLLPLGPLSCASRQRGPSATQACRDMHGTHYLSTNENNSFTTKQVSLNVHHRKIK
jgi:hypothetical protein